MMQYPRNHSKIINKYITVRDMVGGPSRTMVKPLRWDMVGGPSRLMVKPLRRDMVGRPSRTKVKPLRRDMVGRPSRTMVKPLRRDMVSGPRRTRVKPGGYGSDIHRGIHFTLKYIINDQLSRDSRPTPPCVKTSPNNQAFIWDENKKSQFANFINIKQIDILSDKINSENDMGLVTLN